MKQAREANADLVVFPEYFLTGGNPRVAAAMYDKDGVYRKRFQQLAAQHAINIVPGTIMSPHELGEGARAQNVAYYIDRTGAILGEYRKVQGRQWQAI